MEVDDGLRDEHSYHNASDMDTVVSTALSDRHLVGIQKLPLGVAQLHSLYHYSITGSKLDTPPLSLRL